MDDARDIPLPMIRYLANPEIEREIGRRLETRRLDLHLSQQVIANRSGLPHPTIAAIESGEGSSLAAVIAILRALNSLDTLENFLPVAEPRRSEKGKFASAASRSPEGDLWKWSAGA